MSPATPLKLCSAKIYDLSMDLVAYLENVYGVTYTMRENQVWEATFELPAGDLKHAFCLDNHYVELFDVAGTRIELFRIISSDSVRRKGEIYVRYECEHVLATLLDQALLVEMNAGPNTATAITDLLAMQNVAHWQLGTCDFARNFLYYWIEGTSLLAALWSIAGRLYDETWQWTFDTTSHPWTLNLVEPGDDVVAVIDYRLNMEELKRTRQARKIVNRIYPRGNGAGVDQLTIMAVNITGAATTVAVEALPDQKDVEVASAVGFAGGSHVYLENAAGEWEINDVASVAGPVLTMDNDLLHTYAIGDVCHIGEEFVEDATSQTVNGLKEYPWKDERYTIAQNLYDAAIARLAVLKDPAYTYAAKGVDLWPLIGEHRFQLGELVRVRDNELDVLIDARVTVLKQRDVTGKPQSIEVQFDNKIPLFGENLGDIIWADDLDGVSSGGYYSKVYSTQVYAGKILLSAVPGGIIGSMPNPPAAAGTYLSAEYIGIHNGTDWITYMDNAARLIADDGSGDAYFRFDPTLIAEAKVQIKGTVLIEAGDTYDDIQQALADAAAAQAAADGSIVGFFQDAEPVVGMAFGDIWIDTDEAEPLTTAAIYRYEDAAGGSQGVLDWRAAPTNAVGLVYLNAATAQTTADGKITTFYQDAEPGAGMAEGDFWVDTNDGNKLYVYSGAAWVAASSADAIQALADAATALAVADGEIVGFYQDAEPGAGMFFGDIWIDTNGADPLDTTCIYRYEDAAGGSQGVLAWRAAAANAVGLVYLNAYTAQTTADGKITTFYQDAEPGVGMAEGDFWVDTNDGNKTYVYSGAAWVAVSSADALQALADAATALAVADGQIVGYYQDAEPGAGMSFGDIWVDTNGADPLDTTCIYRYEDAAGGSQGVLAWRAAATNAVALVYLNAYTAQTTADGKITTFYQDAEPGAGMAEGDFWVDTNDSNKTYVYSGAAWVAVSSADALQALADAAAALAAADGKIVTFFQDAEPTAEGVGDIWFDTDDGNMCYRWSGSAWVLAQDTDIPQAIAAAAGAQGTADGKVTTFYQDEQPTAEGVGDLWVDTNDSNKLTRWSGAAWEAITGAVAQLTVIGNAYITDLSAAKLTAGDITVGLNVNTGGSIKSNNYSPGWAGWKINADGSAEFQDVTVRGVLNANDLTLGTLAMARIAGLAITGSKIATGTITVNKLDINGNLSFNGSNSIIGIDKIFRSDAASTTQPYIQLANTSLILYSGSTAGNLIALSAVGTLGLTAGSYMSLTFNGDSFSFISAVANDSLSFDLGHEGYIECLIGGVTRYIAFRET